jgi:hypothetical protein
MANLLLLGTAAAAAFYFGYLKPKRDRSRSSSNGSGSVLSVPRIVFTTDCEWDIPDAWWTEVANPRFTTILENTLGGSDTWDAKKAKLATINSHVLAHQLLEGQVPADCPLPAANADVFNPPSALREELMYNLFAHVISHVEASLIKFAQSQGTIVEFPIQLEE